jgi:hypothetical protein
MNWANAWPVNNWNLPLSLSAGSIRLKIYCSHGIVKAMKLSGGEDHRMAADAAKIIRQALNGKALDGYNG